MSRAKLFVYFVSASILAAGLFGIVHDQISYSISPEYYTKFKFFQFGLLDAAVPQRIRVAEVGFLATWWMGVPLGILCGLAGFIQRSPALMQRALLWSLVLVPAFTLATALAGLSYGWLQTATADGADYPHWIIPRGVEHLHHFLSVGYMHNFAYLGGGLAIPVAWIFHALFRARTKAQPGS